MKGHRWKHKKSEKKITKRRVLETEYIMECNIIEWIGVEVDISGKRDR